MKQPANTPTPTATYTPTPAYTPTPTPTPMVAYSPASAPRPKTKIVCTLGPSSWSPDTVGRLMDAGMTVARLNLSHDTLDRHRETFDCVREASKDKNIPVGVMVDIPGPKYRTGRHAKTEGRKSEDEDEGDGNRLYLRRNSEIRLTGEDAEGTARRLSVHPSEPEGIHQYAKAGDTILVDDGMIALEAVAIEGEDVVCNVITGGHIKEGRGVAIRRRLPNLPFLDDHAKKGLEFAAEMGADFLALSNVTDAANVSYVRQRLEDDYGYKPFIISKIETYKAVEPENFDAILEASDGIMVARGDLAVSIDLESVPIMQDMMITKCIRAGKPVITATQMLQSMETSPMPTRAEATDVSNAVDEGTDAVMLSGETAVGSRPVEATETMRDLAMRRERELDSRRQREAGDRAGRIQATLDYFRMFEDESGRISRTPRVDDEVSYRAAQLANTLGARCIVAFTESGNTARLVSRYKPIAPILALTPKEETQRTLTVSWGVTPVLVDRIADDNDARVRKEAERQAVKAGFARRGNGERIALTYGTPIGVSGSTNLTQALEI